jgi:hypothetical protein
MTPLQQATVVAVIVIAVAGFGISAVKQAYQFVMPDTLVEQTVK